MNSIQINSNFINNGINKCTIFNKYGITTLRILNIVLQLIRMYHNFQNITY